MNLKRSNMVSVSASLLVIAMATPVFAQATSDNGNTGDIVVTARRTAERLQDVPISITVVNQQQITNRNIVIAADLATYTPSLSVNQQFGPEKATYAIRGFFQSDNTAPTVGVYFNDVVVQRGYGGTLSGSTPPVGSFMDLDNVQVLKGPQGTLFGRNTTAGSVLLVPKKPTDKLEGNIEGSIGDYSMRRIQGVLNIPLSDTFKVRVALDRNKRDGYYKNHSGIGPNDFEDLNYFAARVGVLANLTDNLENYFLATYSNSDTNGVSSRVSACDSSLLASNGFSIAAHPEKFLAALFAPSACAQIARQAARGDGKLDVENSDPNPFQQLKNWQVSNTTTWTAGDNLTIKNIASYVEFRERDAFNLYGDNFTVPNPAPQLGLPLTPGQRFSFVQISTPPGSNAAGESQFTEEFQLQGRALDGNFIWQAGAYLQMDRPIGEQHNRTSIIANCPNGVNDTTTCTNPLFIGAISEFGNHLRNTNKAVYAQATYKITPKVSVTGGFRYTADKLVGEVQAGDDKFNPDGSQYKVCLDALRFPGVGGALRVVNEFGQCSVTIPVKSSKPTWMIDFDYKPVEDVLLYAKYSRGYRQGGLTQAAVGLEQFGPEKLDAYEVGAKASFHGAVPAFFNIAAFYNNLTQQQINASAIPKDASLSTADPIINAGKSRIAGVEVDGQATFFHALRFNVGYAYIDTKLKSLTIAPLSPTSPYSAVLSTAAIGQPLSFTPKHRVTLDANYRLPLPDEIGEISVGGTFTYTSSQIFNQAAPAQFRNLPGTKIVNANVNWSNVFRKGIDASFFVTNLTNKIYRTALGGGFDNSGFENIFYGAPRMYGFRLKYSFGE